MQTLAADECPVARQPVVLEDPAAAVTFEVGVDPRHARIPGDLHIGIGSATEHQPFAVERDHPQPRLAVAQEQERRPPALCDDELLHLARPDRRSQDLHLLRAHAETP